MRWFKHPSYYYTQEKMSRLLDKFGHTGYSVWMIIQETIAGEMNKDQPDRCYVKLSLKDWCRKSKVSKKFFKSFLNYLQDISLINFIFEDDDITLECPELLARRDESTLKQIRTSKKTPDSFRNNSGKVPEQDTHIDTHIDTDTEHTQTLVHVHDDLKTSYMKKIEGRFSDYQVRNPKTFQMLSDWIKAKVNLDDIQNAFESKQNENVTVPWYFKEVVIGFAKARQDGKPIPGKKMTNEEVVQAALVLCEKKDRLRELENGHH